MMSGIEPDVDMKVVDGNAWFCFKVEDLAVSSNISSLASTSVSMSSK